MGTAAVRVTGAQPSAVTLLSLSRLDTRAAVAFPSGGAMSPTGGGLWSVSFTDPAPGLAYSYGYAVSWPNGQVLASTGLLGIDAAAVLAEAVPVRKRGRRVSVVVGYAVTVNVQLIDDAGRPYDAADGTPCVLSVQRDDVSISASGRYSALSGAVSFPLTAAQLTVPVGQYQCRVTVNDTVPTEEFTLDVEEG